MLRCICLLFVWNTFFVLLNSLPVLWVQNRHLSCDKNTRLLAFCHRERRPAAARTVWLAKDLHWLIQGRPLTQAKGRSLTKPKGRPLTKAKGRPLAQAKGRPLAQTRREKVCGAWTTVAPLTVLWNPMWLLLESWTVSISEYFDRRETYWNQHITSLPSPTCIFFLMRERVCVWCLFLWTDRPAVFSALLLFSAPQVPVCCPQSRLAVNCV